MHRKNEQTIDEIIREFLKVSQLENRVFEDRIAEVWQESLGEAVTKETDRIHLSNGYLFVELKSPALKNDLMMRRTAIARVLNEKLGHEVVKQVVIR